MRLLIGTALLLSVSVYGQSLKHQDDSEVSWQKFNLLTDLQFLEAEAAKLGPALARASAKVSIADAAWGLDRTWSQKLLREAYELTLPDQQERERLRSQPVGTAPVEMTRREGAIASVRARLFSVASRDKTFFQKMTNLAKEELGRQQAVTTFSALAAGSIAASDTKTASTYVLKVAETDPTQISTMGTILNIATRDRDLADKLILAYIEKLRTVGLTRNSAMRVCWFLREMVFPGQGFANMVGKQIPPASDAVIKAYLNYVIESLTQLEQSEPGSGASFRGELLWTWVPIQRYAPELVTAFLDLERTSRISARYESLPTRLPNETSADGYTEIRKKALDTKSPADLDAAIGYALGADDFQQARRLLDLLPDGDLHTRRAEDINRFEAISLVRKDDLLEARRLAERLTEPISIMSICTAIIGRCVAKKDNDCAYSLTYDLVKRLKRTASKSALPRMISELIKSIMPVNEGLALELFGEFVDLANHAEMDTSDGYVDFDPSVFALLALKNESRMKDVANALQDRSQRVAALAAIYRCRANDLKKKTPSAKAPLLN
jgi:hypothetical protein